MRALFNYFRPDKVQAYLTLNELLYAVKDCRNGKDIRQWIAQGMRAIRAAYTLAAVLARYIL